MYKVELTQDDVVNLLAIASAQKPSNFDDAGVLSVIYRAKGLREYQNSTGDNVVRLIIHD